MMCGNRDLISQIAGQLDSGLSGSGLHISENVFLGLNADRPAQLLSTQSSAALIPSLERKAL